MRTLALGFLVLYLLLILTPVTHAYSSDSGNAEIHVYSDGSVSGRIIVPWPGEENVTLRLMSKFQDEKTTITGIIEGPVEEDTVVNIALTFRGVNYTVRGVGEISVSTINGSLDILIQDLTFDLRLLSMVASFKIEATGVYTSVLNITREDIEYMLYLMGLEPYVIEVNRISDDLLLLIIGTQPLYNVSRTNLYRVEELVLSGASTNGLLRVVVSGTIYGSLALLLSDLQKIGLKIAGVPIGTSCLLGLTQVPGSTGYLQFSNGVLDVKVPRVTAVNMSESRVLQRVALCLSEFGNTPVTINVEPPYTVTPTPKTLKDIIDGKCVLSAPTTTYSVTTPPPAYTVPQEGASRIPSMVAFAVLAIPILVATILFLMRARRKY